MNHLHFVQALDPEMGGGLGSASLGLHLSMRSIGAVSTLLTTVGEGESVRSDGVQGFKRSGPDRAFFAPGLRSAAVRAVEDADVAHGHGFYVYPSFVVSRLARRRQVPLVLHPHGMLEPWAQARSRWRKAIVGRLFENGNMRRASLWRALTSYEADQIRAQGIEAPIAVIPNGVDLSLYPKSPYSIDSSTRRRRLLFLGRLHPKKGLALLIEAWDRVGALANDWELVVAGPDEAGHGAELATAVRQRGLEGSVELVGPVHGERKMELLQSADAFVLPSYSEGFPMAVIEAMASGLPVVVSRESHVDDVSARGAGIECNATADSVTDALRDLFSHDQQALQQMGENGRIWVASTFTWSPIAQALLHACETSLA